MGLFILWGILVFIGNMNLHEEISRIKGIMGLLSEDDDNHIIAYKGITPDYNYEKDGPMFFTKFYAGANHYATVYNGRVLTVKLRFKNPLIVNAYEPARSGHGIPIYADENDKSTYIGTFSDSDINEKLLALGYDGIIVNRRFGDPIDGWEILSLSKDTREFVDM